MISSTSHSLKKSVQPKIITLLRSLLIALLLVAVIKPAYTLLQRGMLGSSKLGQDLLVDNNTTAKQGTDVLATFTMPPLFGKKISATPIATPERVRVAPVPTTTLSLKGIIGTSGKGQALAILDVNEGQGQDGIFTVGDVLPGGGTLTKILLDRVIISKASGDNVLFFDENNGKGEIEGLKQSSLINESRKRSVPEITLRQDISGSFLKEKLANLTDLSKEVGVQIYKENSLQIGYRLTSTKGSTLLTTLGLKPGDIVTEINGVKLLNIRQGMKVFSGMRNATQIRLAVKRGGVEKSFVYSLQ